MTALQGLPAPACFSDHLRLSSCEVVAGLVAPREVGDELRLRVAAAVDDDAAQLRS